MKERHSKSSQLRLRTEFKLPKIENVSTKILRQRSQDRPILHNFYEERKQQAATLFDKKMSYSLFVNKNFLPAMDPKLSQKVSERVQDYCRDVEAEKVAKRRENYEIFVKKQAIGKQYLKENRVPLKGEVLASKAREIVRSFALKECDAEGAVSRATEAELLRKKQALLAMNRLNGNFSYAVMDLSSIA